MNEPEKKIETLNICPLCGKRWRDTAPVQGLLLRFRFCSECWKNHPENPERMRGKIEV